MFCTLLLCQELHLLFYFSLKGHIPRKYRGPGTKVVACVKRACPSTAEAEPDLEDPAGKRRRLQELVLSLLPLAGLNGPGTGSTPTARRRARDQAAAATKAVACLLDVMGPTVTPRQLTDSPQQQQPPPQHPQAPLPGPPASWQPRYPTPQHPVAGRCWSEEEWGDDPRLHNSSWPRKWQPPHAW